MKKTKVKHELLAPVGNYESLIAAINSGADAVYFGGKKFGARAFANNFTEEEIEDIIKLCHLYGVKVYITVNTLIHDAEIEAAIAYIKKIHRFGVDAVIMQDVGLMSLVHHILPNLEIHASTQMHNHSKESLSFLESLGIKRVVFAREMPLDYLKEIDTPIEKEVFIHGSLCISYSGQCLFSSCILGRSGNRGECAGMCRLPYKLLENGKYLETAGKYLLSPKDLCSVADFEKLLDSDIVSFKIEGRMKSPAYVGTVTRIYKKLINQYENGEALVVDEKDFELLQAIFNREYTNGFLFNNSDIMNYFAPNHMGIHLGKVLEISKKKIKIKLDHDLHQFEGIRFVESNKGITLNFLYDEKDNLINSARNGDIIYIDNFINLKTLDEIVLTTPLTKEEKEVTKKIKINVNCLAKVGSPITLVVSDDQNKVKVEGEIVEEAKTSPITSDRIKSALNKTGNTPFVIDDITITCDESIFISIGTLNNLRRDALEKLKTLRENRRSEYKELPYTRNNKEVKNEGLIINVLARNKEQIDACNELGIKNVIVEDPGLMSPYFIFKVPRDKMTHDYPYDNLLVTDYASLDKYPNQIADYHLNVFNHYTFDYLQDKARSVMLSVELSFEDIQKLMSHYPNGANAEVLVYGREELMLMKHCLLNKLVNKNKICNVCKNGNEYNLEDRNGARYPIISNSITHSTTILNYKVNNRLLDIQKFKEIGIRNFRVEFNNESYDEAKEILLKIINEIMQ